MQVVVNDEAVHCAEGVRVSELLIQLQQDKPGVALALNQHILPRTQWDHHPLQDGDSLLLFQVIAGG